MKRTLERHHREVLRDLLLGYVEHCEVAPNLVGTLDHTFLYEGVKYGIPAFSFRGPIPPDGPTRFVGLVAGRRGGDRLSAEVTLQLIERLILQPGLGEGFWLRVLPVLDPVGLEKGEDDAAVDVPTPSDKNTRLHCGDGIIEIAATDRPFPCIGVRGGGEWKQAALGANEALVRLVSENPGEGPDRFAFQVAELPPKARLPWDLYFGLPASWNTTEATHFASQWLLVFFRLLRERARLRALSAEDPADQPTRRTSLAALPA